MKDIRLEEFFLLTIGEEQKIIDKENVVDRVAHKGMLRK